MNGELLLQLAEAYGLGTSYRASNGLITAPPETSYVKLLRALGVSLDDEPGDEELQFHLQARRAEFATRPLPPCVVATAGYEKHFNVHVHDGHYAHCWIKLEDGSSRDAYQDENWTPPFTADDGVTWGEATFHVPGDLPIGWHELHLESDDLDEVCTLIVVPEVLETNQEYIQHPVWGVMAQLYSVRSEESWGIGDFNDLGRLAEIVAAEGADFLQINPVHAAQPVPPVEDSPYLPTSRRFVNPIYISVEAVPEFRRLSSHVRVQIMELAKPLKRMNRTAEPLDRDTIFRVKLTVLRELFFLSMSDEARANDFEMFVEDEGEGLEEFARWCAQQAVETELSRHAGPQELDELTQFYMWLQFIADEQRRIAQERAEAAGMKIGIMTDLAVGIHPGGADAHALRDVLVADASVGAPPDQYSQQGQDWSQPPWNPQKLAEAGYGPWRDLLRTVLRHSGGVRVDHILGLFRLFWLPRMDSPAEGAYMNYDHEAMVGVLALEAQRAGAVVVGEDLGTFEPWVQEVLRDKGILGTTVLWFESTPWDNSPLPSEQYRNLSLTAVGTHDLPPTAGYMKGAHNELRHELGLVQESLDELNANDAVWISQVLAHAQAEGAFKGTSAADLDFMNRDLGEYGDVNALLIGLTRFIASTPSAMTCTNLVDMVGDERIQNQPGTNSEQYENWCIPLTDAQGNPVLLEHLKEMELFHRVAEASRRPGQ
ncbi:4-alpha-glucanotransferase [Corynebacterium glaucum]|uniref:4-alpha-glucanotransferase n=1 Tax=Corynebacterium glaucum TaxID=187491 RepID=A0A1Q2HYB5_9CORY|nr:4-alpha-glucanotransferase [Corynebacterium glaucum]AQQ15838.1 4-alpha-glucanotransferase [Corynebacterium glaucum]WJZ08322.1 4-alpha-glucanotransferase [Corynebacterium glaucum]